MKTKPHSQDKEHRLLLIDIGSACYMKKRSKNLPPIRKYKLSKKGTRKR